MIALAALAAGVALALVVAAQAIAAEPVIVPQEGEVYPVGTRVTGPCDPNGDPDGGTTSEFDYTAYGDREPRDYRDLHNDWARSGSPSGGWWVRPLELRDAAGTLLPKCAPLTLRHPGVYTMNVYPAGPDETEDERFWWLSFSVLGELADGFICFGPSLAAASSPAVTATSRLAISRASKRHCPTPHRRHHRRFKNCEAFGAWVKENFLTITYPNYLVHYRPDVRKTRPRVVDVELTYSLDKARSSVGQPVFTWPSMTAKEKRALAKMLEALAVHEHGHLTVAERFAKRHPDKFTARNQTEAEALVKEYMRKFTAALDEEEKLYDHVTKNGKSQRMGPYHGFPGGENVMFECP